VFCIRINQTFAQSGCWKMEFIEKTLESKRIYDGRVVSLRVDTVLLPDGNIASREVVEHKGAVAVVPMLVDGSVILVRQFRQPVGAILSEIPAGTLDKFESAEDCARRELIEETGYAAGTLILMFSTYLSPGYSNEMLHTFLARDLSPADGRADSDEFLEVVTVPLAEAVDMIRTGEIKDAKTVCGLLMAQRILGQS